MKHWKKRLLAAGLCLSLLTGQAALASDALGHDLHTARRTLSQGTALNTGWFWSDTYSDLRTERYVTYTPNEAVTPVVAYGDNVLQRATLTAMAQKLEAAGKRVVGGSNGDFYVLTTGQPLGLVVTDGILRSSSSYHSAVGFRADGSAFVGTPNLQITANIMGMPVTVFGGVNKVRQIRSADGGGLTLLTEDFGTSTQNTSPGVDVILHPVEEGVGETVPAGENPSGQELTVYQELRIGGRVNCVVDYITEAAGPNPIPEGSFVLTMNGQDDEGTLNMLRALQTGDVVTIDVTSADPRWNEATEALGAMYRLLDNGQLGPNLSTERTARTAVGVKEDGTVIFYTIDGKQPGLSVGATCTQVAMRLLELGCVEAVGLDGGGSTTLGVTDPTQSVMGVVNSPSDGAQRANSTALFLTTDLKPTGAEGGELILTPGDAVVLSGMKLSFSANLLDTAWYDMGPTNARYDVLPESGGTISSEGEYVAGSNAGQDIISAKKLTAVYGKDENGSLMGSTGTAWGEAVVTVVKTPDKIIVSNEATGGVLGAISLEPGESVSLTASAGWRGLTPASRDDCYTWECDPEVGTITPDGLFTATDKTASGQLRVTAGERTAVLPVNVAGHILTLMDFEGEESVFTSTDTVTAEIETDLASVRTGRQSLRLDYTLDAMGTALVETDLAVPAGETHLGLWVKGDGSGNNLFAVFADEDGEETLSPVCILDFDGWRHVLVPIPAGTKLTGLQFIYGGGQYAAGTVWLDQLTTANEALEDFTAPTVSLTVKGNSLTASVSDNVDRTLDKADIKLVYDGWGMDFQWNAATGALTATLPEAGDGTHRITVTAVDASGNVGQGTYEIVGDSPDPFADMTDHWALPYAKYLFQQGITTGVPVGEETWYNPGENITRAEFFTMAARWMRLDLTQYEDVELPFVDAGQIPEWAVPAVKAMYKENIVKGSLEEAGFYAHPNATINRSEAMTILGRTQMKGYPEAELEGFLDVGDIPDWAMSYMKTLVGQKVVNGYEDNTLRPLASMTRGEVAKVLCVLR